jgi:hypothetical protein
VDPTLPDRHFEVKFGKNHRLDSDQQIHHKAFANLLNGNKVGPAAAPSSRFEKK